MLHTLAKTSWCLVRCCVTVQRFNKIKISSAGYASPMSAVPPLGQQYRYGIFENDDLNFPPKPSSHSPALHSNNASVRSRITSFSASTLGRQSRWSHTYGDTPGSARGPRSSSLTGRSIMAQVRIGFLTQHLGKLIN